MFENFEKLFSTHWISHIVRTILSILRDGAPSIIICPQTDPPEQRWVWINYQNHVLIFFCQADETLTSPGADKSEVEDIVSKPSHQSSMLCFLPFSPLPLILIILIGHNPSRFFLEGPNTKKLSIPFISWYLNWEKWFCKLFHSDLI